MKTYIIEITETLVGEFEVQSVSESEAIAKIEDDYRNEKIILDDSNFVYSTFEIQNLKKGNE